MFGGSWFAQNLERHLTESPDIDHLVVRLPVQYLWSEEIEPVVLNLLDDLAIFLFPGDSKVKTAQFRELEALSSL